MSISTRIVQICLFIVAAIALLGGIFQMINGEPEINPRLDNIHRFLAGVYLAMGVISAYTAWTIRGQNALVYLVALAVLLGATGRIVSMSIVGLPEPNAVWLRYLVAELAFPIIIVIAHLVGSRKDI